MQNIKVARKTFRAMWALDNFKVNKSQVDYPPEYPPPSKMRRIYKCTALVALRLKKTLNFMF